MDLTKRAADPADRDPDVRMLALVDQLDAIERELRPVSAAKALRTGALSLGILVGAVAFGSFEYIGWDLVAVALVGAVAPSAFAWRRRRKLVRERDSLLERIGEPTGRR